MAEAIGFVHEMKIVLTPTAGHVIAQVGPTQYDAEEITIAKQSGESDEQWDLRNRMIDLLLIAKASRLRISATLQDTSSVPLVLKVFEEQV